MSQSDSLDLHIGKRLRELRKEHQLSLERLGELLDVSGQQISRFEKGVHKLNASQLYVIAKALGVPLSYFFLHYKESDLDSEHWKVVVPGSKHSLDQNIASDSELQTILLLKWNKLEKEQREALLCLLDVM